MKVINVVRKNMWQKLKRLIDLSPRVFKKIMVIGSLLSSFLPQALEYGCK